MSVRGRPGTPYYIMESKVKHYIFNMHTLSYEEVQPLTGNLVTFEDKKGYKRKMFYPEKTCVPGDEIIKELENTNSEVIENEYCTFYG